MSDFRVIQGCPVNAIIAPYIWIVTNDCHATVNSIYRGEDAAGILHAHGHHTQAELYEMYLNGQGYPANPPGFSTHELRSDGHAYPRVPRGDALAWWQQGFDVNDADVANVEAQAHKRGWWLFRPYQSGSEFHHLNFETKPIPRSPQTLYRIKRLRSTLPRK